MLSSSTIKSLLRRSVDWNYPVCVVWRYPEVAPSQERGLKQGNIRFQPIWYKVAPSQERGLKPAWPWPGKKPMNVAPSQERGLKPDLKFYSLICCRRSFAGAWIEILQIRSACATNIVAPSQERGLKYQAVKTGTVDLLSFLRGSVHWNVIAAIRLKARYRPLFLKKSHQNCHESIKRCLSRC